MWGTTSSPVRNPKRRIGVWIVDHTVQAGRLKCPRALGIRLADVPPPGEHLALRHLEPLGVVPMSCSNGDTVLAQLERHTRVTGTPCAILSDHGRISGPASSGSARGIPGPRPLRCCQHKAASLLKSLLEKDSRWGVFSSRRGGQAPSASDGDVPAWRLRCSVPRPAT